MELSYFEPRNPGSYVHDESSSEPDGANQCRYLFETLSNIISTLSPIGWSAMKTNTVNEFNERYGTGENDGKSMSKYIC